MAGMLGGLLGGGGGSGGADPKQPAPFIPMPDISHLPVKDQKRVIKKWMASNEKVALYNGFDRVMGGVTFTGLFLGLLYLLRSSKRMVFQIIRDKKTGQILHEWSFPVGDPPTDTRQIWDKLDEFIKLGYDAVFESYQKDVDDYINGAAIAAVLTAATYMARNNNMGIIIPLGAIIMKLGFDTIGDLDLFEKIKGFFGG